MERKRIHSNDGSANPSPGKLEILRLSGTALAPPKDMAADAGKVYPSEIHLLKKELEVQGDLLNQESLERKADVYQLKMELESLRSHRSEQEVEAARLSAFEILSVIAAFVPANRAVRMAFRIVGAAEFIKRFRRPKD